jgi:ribosomal protein S18 acetylase RimI-like enzyme
MLKENLEVKIENEESYEIVFGTVDDIEGLPVNPEITGGDLYDDSDGLGINLAPVKFNYENLKKELPLNTSKLLLSKDKEKVIGFVTYTTSSHQNPNFLEHLWVDTNYREKGVAKGLLEKTLSDLNGNISLNLRGGENAKKFFEKYGFVSNPGGGYMNRYTLKREG